MIFNQEVEAWYLENFRDLPWRRTKDPYLIWLSEVILQQTRVNQGLPYYHKFAETFPSIQDLASASEDEVLKLWQGLGYYSRARNLHTAAKEIVAKYNGVLPKDKNKLLGITGIGPYTAAAVSSFAFNEPNPVIDGNVQRVISRYFGISEPIDRKKGQDKLSNALEAVFDYQNPALFNQAIMELGSQVCLPKAAKCQECPVMESCFGYQNNQVYNFPVKSKGAKSKEIKMSYFFIRMGNKTFIEQRKSGFWTNLYQFPLIEGKNSINELISLLSEQLEFEEGIELNHSYHTTHVLSHRKLNVDFYTIDVQTRPKLLNSAIFEIDFIRLRDQYPVPVLIENYLKKILDNGK
ncbi:A/G-specific adenine glycosylase [bacterium]|nr:A/G-specific adenine glycosylase [bacterium]